MTSALVAFLSTFFPKWKRLSLASYVSIAMGCALFTLTGLTWLLFDSEPQRVAWSDYIQFSQVIQFLSLGIVICALSYWTVKTWTDQIPSKDQDVHRAWTAGIKALRHRGVDLADQPVFLLLGCHEPSAQLNFLQKSGFKLAMDPIPADPSAPIRWFIGDTGIFLGCSSPGTFASTQFRMALHRISRDQIAYELCQESIASEVIEERFELAENTVADTQSFAEPSTLRLYAPTASRSHSINASNSNSSATGTATIPCEESKSMGHTFAADNRLTEQHVLSNLELTENLLSDYQTNHVEGADSVPLMMKPKQESEDLLASSEVVRHQSMLDEVCRRLRVVRSPSAPINGTIAWIDAPQLSECISHVRQLGHSLNRDLAQLRDELGMVAPTTIVMDRMEHFPGMVEMIRRAGPQAPTTSLLGQSSDVHEFQTPESSHSICEQSIDAIRRGVYRSFELPMGANHIGNRKLFQFLIASRGHLSDAIQIFVQSALQENSSKPNSPDTPMINGVYFTATGEKPTEQAFGQPIIHRLLHQQDLLNWTQHRRLQETRYRLWVWLLQIVSGFLAILAAIQLIIVLRG